MPNLRLCRETDEIKDPPAPLPISSAPTTQSWRNAGEQSKEDTVDSIKMATRALEDAESKMEQLTELMEEEAESYSFAHWTTPPNDDGPYAA